MDTLIFSLVCDDHPRSVDLLVKLGGGIGGTYLSILKEAYTTGMITVRVAGYTKSINFFNSANLAFPQMYIISNTHIYFFCLV